MGFNALYTKKLPLFKRTTAAYSVKNIISYIKFLVYEFCVSSLEYCKLQKAK